MTKFPRLSDEPPIIVHKSMLQAHGPLGACLLAQIHFWAHSKGKSRWIAGERWADATLSEFSEALGLNLRTVQRGITRLEQEGAVEVTRGANKCYRVTRRTSENGTYNMPNTDVEHATLSSPLIEEETKETRKPSPPSENSLNTRKGKTVIKIVKNTGGKPVVLRKPSSSDSILAGLQKANHGLPEKTPNTKDTARAIWRAAAKHNPEMAQCAPAETVRDLADLKYIAGKLGSTSDRDLKLVTENWVKFTKVVAELNGWHAKRKLPMIPTLAFLKTHVNEAKAFGEKHGDSAPKVATIAANVAPTPVPAPTPAPATPPSGEDEPATMEELLAWEKANMK